MGIEKKVARSGVGIETNRVYPQRGETRAKPLGLHSHMSYNGYKGNQDETEKLTSEARPSVCCTLSC